MSKERLEEIKGRGYFDLLFDDFDFLIKQAEKRVKKEVTNLSPGGGQCPSCDIRLMGKANYCGRCGQRVGWEVYGGNVYDKKEESECT